MRIAIYGKEIRENYLPFLSSLLRVLEEKGISVLIYEKFHHFIQQKITLETPVNTFDSTMNMDTVDYLFSIGGDGTILEAVTLLQSHKTPILGINTGRLGFLSSITTDEIHGALTAILNSDFDLDKRSLLCLDTDNQLFGDQNFALNEITVQKQDTSSMITIHVFLDDEFLNSYWADGLIISTPTGSTAYSLSCNGPVVHPDSNNIILTPIAPHNLNVRPLVIPDNKTLTLKIEGRVETFLVTLDSRSIVTNTNLALTIKKCDHQVRLIRLKEHSFLKTLRNKLMWGLDKRN